MITNWTKLVSDVQDGSRDAVEALYRAVTPGMRMMLAMRVPRCHIDDYTHDAFIALLRYVQSGKISNADCMPGIARTIVLRQFFEHQARRASSVSLEPVSMATNTPDATPTPERRLLDKEKWEVAMKVLQSLRPREREILRRFYLENQSREQICTEMGITETQFRLLKSRAKARFGQLGQRHLRSSLLCSYRSQFQSQSFHAGDVKQLLKFDAQ